MRNMMHNAQRVKSVNNEKRKFRNKKLKWILTVIHAFQIR
tara:strand:- start:399 stop:518 length:120 start_codon:yes stop_codon:yes gene_type:complete